MFFNVISMYRTTGIDKSDVSHLIFPQNPKSVFSVQTLSSFLSIPTQTVYMSASILTDQRCIKSFLLYASIGNCGSSVTVSYRSSFSIQSAAVQSALISQFIITFLCLRILRFFSFSKSNALLQHEPFHERESFLLRTETALIPIQHAVQTNLQSLMYYRWFSSSVF